MTDKTGICVITKVK